MMVGPYAFRRRDGRHAWLTVRRHAGITCVVALVMAMMVSSWSILWVVAIAAPLWVIDLRSRRLPDLLTFPLLIGAMCWAALQEDAMVRLVGMAYMVGGLCLIAWAGHRILGRMVLGGGDIKLIATFPLLVGFLEANYILLLACLLHGVWMAIARGEVWKPVAFGPALLSALFVGLMVAA